MNEWARQGFGSASEATNFALDHLRAHGYSVSLAVAGQWETPGEFLARTGVTGMTFYRRRSRADCPELSDVERSDSGRILRLRSNAGYDAFMQAERI